MPKLAVMQHDERVRLDPEPLVALYADLGVPAAERVISRAVEELSARLGEVFKLADTGPARDLSRSARMLAKVGEQVGMKTLASVAGDLSVAAERSDAVAQAAVLARLQRIGERSLHAVWTLPDLSL